MLKTLGVHFIRHPCLTRTVRVRPQCQKTAPRSLSGRKCSGVCQNAVVWVGASLRRLCATAIVHPCTSCLLCWFRIRASSAVWVATSVHRQPFVPLHLCNDSHLCRCIVQRLCVAVFMHPCITTLCDRYRASFARL